MDAKTFLYKVKKRYFGKAFSTVSEDMFLVEVARAFSLILKARKKADTLVTAYTDTRLYNYTEVFADLGFVWKDSTHTFFGGNPKDTLHLYNPLEEIKNFHFDVVLGPNYLDIHFFSNKIKNALKEIKNSNFRTCLNVQKLMLLAAIVCLLPDNSTILEVGAYQCGTTIFLAQLCKELNKKMHIISCDTFGGMPAATTQDKQDPVFYDSGMFTNNPLKKVLQRIKNQKLERYIQLVKGDVTETLPNLHQKEFSLIFLDTDQYKGTKAGLEFLENHVTFSPEVIVDDTGLSSVSTAIDEFLGRNSSYTRKKLSTNFDYLIPESAVEPVF